MSNLYLWLDILSVLFPVLLSFDKKVAFVKDWKYVFIAIVAIGIPFVIWDIWFTHMGVWGFNPDYLTGFSLSNLPIEEVLFFVVVPFSCTFIYACVKAYFKKIKLTGFNRIFYAALIIYTLSVMLFGWQGWYSKIAGILALITVFILQKINVNLYYLPLAFVISLIPFFIVNGVLTGTGIESEIVWYNDAENAGKRFFTIPIDDIVYAWTLLAGNIAIYQWLLDKNRAKG